jgi:hypothetical protein
MMFSFIYTLVMGQGNLSVEKRIVSPKDYPFLSLKIEATA